VTEPDDELVRALRQAADPVAPVDTEAALSRVRSRSLVVRRRRATVSGAALVVAGVAFGSIWLASRPADQTQVDTVSSPTSPISSTLPTTVPTTLATTTPTAPPTIGPTAPGASPVPAPSVPTQTTTSPRSASGPVTFRGAGGSVTARVQGGVLQLLSVQPAAGYRVSEQRVDPDEIEVRFESDAGRTQVKLRLEQGRISPEVDESSNDEGGDHGGTAPVQTEPNHGPGDDGHGSHGGDGGGGSDGASSDGGSSDSGGHHGRD
jgi:uncharacterized membrane protein YgcG